MCDACLAGKQRRTPFSKEAKWRDPKVQDLVHADFCGLVTPPIPSGKKMFLHLVNDHSLFTWLLMLGAKDEAAMAIRVDSRLA